jgi:hypothetical protein
MHKMILTTAALFSISLSAMENNREPDISLFTLKDKEEPTFEETLVRLLHVAPHDMQNTGKLTVDQMVKYRLAKSCTGWPKAFKNKEYAEYFVSEARNVLLTIDPNKIVLLNASDKTKVEIPLIECCLISLMNPKPISGKSFNFQFANWKRAIERYKSGDIRSNDFAITPMKKATK